MSNAMLDLIASRRSHRAYESTPVTEEQLHILLDAALQSPSAVNRQPWHFSVVQNQELLRKMNREIACQVSLRDPESRNPRFNDPKFDVFYHAPLVIFISADPAWRYSSLDCGIAVENIALAAESIGLGSVILGMPRDAFAGERKAEFEKALDFLPGEEFMIAIAIGVPADDKPAHPIREGHISYIG